MPFTKRLKVTVPFAFPDCRRYGSSSFTLNVTVPLFGTRYAIAVTISVFGGVESRPCTAGFVVVTVPCGASRPGP